MSNQQRLAAEWESLRKLKDLSSIFDFEASGEPPTRYTLIFRGRGIARHPRERNEMETVELHRVEVRLPESFPNRAPDMRWATPLFHPNISFSGFIHLRDIGLDWENQPGLDVICERLWDVARLAYMDLQTGSHYAARDWFRKENRLELPLDRRPLRDRAPAGGVNVIRYQRLGTGADRPTATEPTEILFIDENTPTPKLPVRFASPRRARPDDDEIYFIGDD